MIDIEDLLTLEQAGYAIGVSELYVKRMVQAVRVVEVLSRGLNGANAWVDDSGDVGTRERTGVRSLAITDTDDLSISGNGLHR